MLLVYRHTLIVLYICLCIACFAGNIVWALLLFGASTSNTSPSSAVAAHSSAAAPSSAAAAPTVAAGAGVDAGVVAAVAAGAAVAGVDAGAGVVAAVATTTTTTTTTTTAAATAAAATNTSKSTEYIITIKNDVSLQLLKVVCIILNAIVIPLLIYFFYTYRKTWW